MNYLGVIVEESLENKQILKKVKILDTKIESVTEDHKTPWIKEWTLHDVEIKEDEADKVAEELSQSLDKIHDWCADFRNDDYHYIIFRNKVFKVDRSKKEQYQLATDYGISLGIPDYQLDFSPHIKEREKK